MAAAYVQTHGGQYDHLAWVNRGEDIVNAFALNPELADELGVPF